MQPEYFISRVIVAVAGPIALIIGNLLWRSGRLQIRGWIGLSLMLVTAVLLWVTDSLIALTVFLATCGFFGGHSPLLQRPASDTRSVLWQIYSGLVLAAVMICVPLELVFWVLQFADAQIIEPHASTVFHFVTITALLLLTHVRLNQGRGAREPLNPDKPSQGPVGDPISVQDLDDT